MSDNGYNYTLRWENPCPGKKVEKLEIVSEKRVEALLLLYAVTLEG